MSNRFKILFITLSVGIVVFVLAGTFGVRASSNDGAYRQLGVYSEVLSRIRSEYVEEPNIALVTDGSLHGLLESLDANSSYMNPAEYKHYKQQKSNGKGDIGATISKRFGYAAVVSTIPGGPADKAGVDTGDIIEAIEGKSTRDLSLAEIHTLLAGEPGSNVSFSVVRARRAEPQKITATREVVTVPPVTAKMLDDNIGYIKADTLTKGKAQEIAGKVKELERSGARKLILDLRNCSDGDEGEGIATANLFLDHGIITYVQGQKYSKETFNADASKDISKLPLAVMVNRGTAGAGEITAAAILENGRGDVVGDKTFGMGSVQKLIDLPDGSALILSVAKYYTPGGKAIQDTAVTPNVMVADADEDAALPDDDSGAVSEQEIRKSEMQREDEQLHRAIDVLEKRSGK